jgi:hypothetical protein
MYKLTVTLEIVKHTFLFIKRAEALNIDFVQHYCVCSCK